MMKKANFKEVMLEIICELINKRLPKVYKWWEKELKRINPSQR